MEPVSQFRLFVTRRFSPFFATQALGAFNDNIFRNALATLIVFQAARMGGLTTDQIVNLAAMLFILPYFLFSAMVGQFADRFDKKRQIVGIKMLEVGICLFAAIGLYTNNLPLLLGIVFLLGLQSTLFGPIKYSILPQLLHREELTGGNGLVATGTFVAILGGTILGPILAGIDVSWPWWVLVATLVVALAGLASSLAIPRVPIAQPDLKLNWNPVTETWRNLRYLSGNRVVFNGVLGISWFWFFGSIFLVQIPSYTEGVIGGNERVLSALLALFIIGISIGALLCEKLSIRRVEIGLVPIGALGLTVFGIDLYFASPEQALDGAGIREVLAIPGIWRVIADLVLIGISGGLFIVPLYALVQTSAEPERRARVIAGMNILNALMMVLAAVSAMVLLGNVGLSIPQLFMVTAILNGLVAIYIFSLVPTFVLRFLMWALSRMMYRVRMTGTRHIPEDGPALLVCNHVSFMDPLLIGGSIDRPVRFVMTHRIYYRFGMKWLFRLAGAIPIAPKDEDPQCREAAWVAIDEALKKDEIVGIFPEGKLSPDGQVGRFKPGVERILKENPVPVVVGALYGMWGSMFSRSETGRRGLFRPVRIRLTKPLKPAEAEVSGLEIRVRELHDRLREEAG